MSGIIDARLEELRVVLPSTTKPVANFVPCVQTGSLLFVSGQIPTWNGELRYVGRVGAEIIVDDASAAARASSTLISAPTRPT